MIAAAKHESETHLLVEKPSFKSFFATCSFAAGFVVSIAGTTLWLISIFERRAEDIYVTIAIIAAFVLFACGAHCIDLIDAENRKDRS